jgi:hydroxymethylbilane synthase
MVLGERSPIVSVVRIGTRSSELAMRQAGQVQAALAARGVAGELVTYTTTGDRRLDVALTAIGGKGLFTKELEDDLLAGRVDCCVHSLKDLPTDGPVGLMVVARLEREDPRDALVVGPGPAAAGVVDLGGLAPGARVGTSSLRRRAQLLASRPDLEVVELRGNVPTRLRKVDEGQVDAAILAAAGLHRLGAGQRVSAYLDAPGWLPAAGQGAIAVQVRVDDSALRAVLAALDHAPTTLATRAERAFLAALNGGCQVPIGALAVARDGRHTLYGMVGDVTGGHVVRGECALDPGDPERAGVALAEEVRSRGGAEILARLRGGGQVPAPQPE